MTTCGKCHRPLSKDESVRRGLGPICYAQLQGERAQMDQKEPLSDHFGTIMYRFIRDARISEKEAEYWNNEAKKAIEDKDNGKDLAVEIAYEAVHWVLSGKSDVIAMRSSVAKDIANMFDLAGKYKEGEKQEKFLRRHLNKMAKTEWQKQHHRD